MKQSLVFTCLLLPWVAGAYPLDGYPETGIRRVEGSRLENLGEIPGAKQPPGALLSTAEVDIRLRDRAEFEIPAEDRELKRKIEELLGDNISRYGIAVLDISNPESPLFAQVNGDFQQNIGSVGKLVVAMALFQALADTWPDEHERVEVLKSRQVVANEFAHWDEHAVLLFDVGTRKRVKRPIRDGDAASLWEYLDWMLSASSNAAAGMLMREAMLIRQYGSAYPPTDEETRRFFAETPKKELTELYRATFYEPMTHNGFDLDNFRQGSFFTAVGKARVPGPGSSHSTARSLLQFALLMEQGKLVDDFSSVQLKRLLYDTERRIRYASAPRLQDAAVYFKSGSLYSCKPEEDFSCGKYKGNVKNYMNSFAIIESPATGRRLHYMVMLLSNVLRKNSAVDHQTLATRIQRLIEQMHPEPKDTAVESN